MTPMFAQYHELKSGHPEAILFFRMGDFYECFFDDAEVVARELDLTLTARNKQQDNPIPMAGVPHHAAAGYINRLTTAGYRVAIAEQVEDPAVAKGLVRREVVRVVTPGVVLDPTSLDSRESNYLVAVGAEGGEALGVAFLDLSTGDLRLANVDSVDAVISEIHRLEPKEYLLDPSLIDPEPLRSALKRHGALYSTLDPDAWSVSEARSELRRTLGVRSLGGFGVEGSEPGVRAAGALVRYARDNTGGRIGNLHTLHVYHPHGFMVIDDTSRRNLEITRTLIGSRRHGTLLWLLDRAASSLGSRRIREYLAFPSLDLTLIRGRHAAVRALVDDTTLQSDLRAGLKEVADVERIAARVTQGTAHARDLAALRRSLLAAPSVVERARSNPALVNWLPDDLCGDVARDLARWLVDDPPMGMSDGGLIRRGPHGELDEIVELALEGVGIIGRLEESEREATGIGSLKIKKNRVFGYFIEVTRAHLHRVPDHYLRKQTLTNAERYITPELKELEERVLGADERRKQLEYALFVELRDRVAEASSRLQELASRLADLDALSTLALVSVRHRWVEPKMTADPVLEVRGCRHPVVEALLEEERFVPNDIRLDTRSRQLVILTGPNMAGKSTVMRQTAVVVLLAQIGCFVPAQEALIGVCDRIFTRVGASDDLSRGQSTFMVEMSETAAILHHATERSLVLLDEIGRGTSTYDGLAIAWAVGEDLADRIRCRAIFATHYHELCELANTRDGVVNQSVAVSEWEGQIVFLRTLREGGANRSYGIQCARLAGLPGHVVERSKSLLRGFEKHAPRNAQQQLSLFGVPGQPIEAPEEEVVEDPLRAALATADPDALTPRLALELLYELRSLL